MPTSPPRLVRSLIPLLTSALLTGQQLTRDPSPQPNPYKLEPFEPAFPVALEYPPMKGLEYARTRRQALRQVAENLQGNTSRETWQLATEFFWRAPEDVVDPLTDVMDLSLIHISEPTRPY